MTTENIPSYKSGSGSCGKPRVLLKEGLPVHLAMAQQALITSRAVVTAILTVGHAEVSSALYIKCRPLCTYAHIMHSDKQAREGGVAVTRLPQQRVDNAVRYIELELMNGLRLS